MKKTTLNSIYLAFAISLIAIYWTDAAQTQTDDVKRKWINNQVIVKFDSDLSEKQINNEIHEIDQEFPLLGYKQLFKDQRSFDEIAKQFPQRAKRMPKQAKPVSTRNTYVFTFVREDYDILEICQKLKARKSVEYAEPNQLVTTHKVQGND